jgi:tetratricopeptide (TPR) repeat protein
MSFFPDAAPRRFWLSPFPVCCYITYPMPKFPLRLFLAALFLPLSFLQAQAPQPLPPKEYQDSYQKAADLMGQEKFEEALAEIDKADQIKPNYPATYNLKGAILVRLKKLPEAEAVFRKGLEAEPNNPLIIFNIGECAFLQKNYAAAKIQFEKFMQNEENKGNALGRYKVFLCDLMLDDKKAVNQLLDTVEPSVRNPLYYFAHAAAEFKAGREAEAKGYLQSAFGIYAGGTNATFADSLIELGWLKKDDISVVNNISAATLQSMSDDPAPGQGDASTPSFDDALPSLIPGGDKKDKDKKN